MSSAYKSTINSNPSPSIDLIIVGAGIAGLSVGLSVLKKYARASVVILEKYGYVGGRITTYHKTLPNIGKVQWENGAARISNLHKNILGLLDHYNLHTQPIPQESEYRSASGIISRTSFDSVFRPIGDTLSHTLSSKTLATHTLTEILPEEITEGIFDRFPYWAELRILRADLALEEFKTDLNTESGFVVCQEGLGELIQCMRKDFESRGGIIYQNTEVVKIQHNPVLNYDTVTFIRTSGQDPALSVKLEMAARGTVLALHAKALQTIFSKSLPKSQQPRFLSRLQMTPLVRQYAIFPTKKSLSWFSNQPITVLPSPLRYFIPIQPSKGIVMISYTEGPDASHWAKKMETDGTDAVEKEVMSLIRRAFPEKSGDNAIPDPVFFKVHPWTEGCTYWLPGEYDPYKESNASLHPCPEILPTTFVCGESTSTRQAWMEGALEQAEKLYSIPKFWDIFCNCEM